MNKYELTGLGTCFIVYYLPPKAVPFQTRPVTSWKGRVDISCPAAATPIMVDTPQPLWQDSRAALYNTQTQSNKTLNTEYSLQHTNILYRNQLSNSVLLNKKYFYSGGGGGWGVFWPLKQLKLVLHWQTLNSWVSETYHTCHISNTFDGIIKPPPNLPYMSHFWYMQRYNQTP